MARYVESSFVLGFSVSFMSIYTICGSPILFVVSEHCTKYIWDWHVG